MRVIGRHIYANYYDIDMRIIEKHTYAYYRDIHMRIIERHLCNIEPKICVL